MEAIIVKWVGSIITALKLAGGYIVTRVMAALGLSWASFEYVLPEVKAYLVDKAALLPSEAVQFFSAIGLDVFMVMIVSAVVARVGMQVFLVGTAKLESMIAGASN